MSDLATRLHALYRFYGSDGELLYVGISANPGNRFGQHRDDKPWWLEVARIDMEHFASRHDVLTAEREAIRTEAPRYNKQHAGRTTTTTGPVPSPRPRLTWVGRVGAFALDDGTCPVGLVSDETDGWLTLELYSWISGYFGHGCRRLPVSRIRQLCLATRMNQARAEERGLVVSPGDVVWDMDPLADFQSAWTKEKRRG